MSVRTTTLAFTAVGGDSLPAANTPVTFTLTPPTGNVPLLDTAGELVDTTPIVGMSSGVGAVSQALIPNGDITPAGSTWTVQFLATTLTKSFVYSGSPIDPTSWAPANPTSGLIRMDLTMVLGNAAPSTLKAMSVFASQDAVWTGGVGAGQVVDSSVPVGPLTTDSNGMIFAYLIPNSQLNPATGYYSVTLPSGLQLVFTVPTTYTGVDRGAYAGGTTYALNDIVNVSGVPYISIQAANTGHTPASSPTWWSLYAGEPVTSHLTVAVPSGQIAITQAGMAADAAVLTGSYPVPPVTLQDQLRQLTQIQARHVTASTYTIVTDDDVIDADGTSNAVAITLPSAVGWAKLVAVKAINISHAVTITTTSGQTIDGSAPPLTPGLNTIYVFYSDGANWHVYATNGAGGGGGGSLNSVGLALPTDLFTVTVSPVTGSSGTLIATKQPQSAATILAGPTSGAAAAPTFRALAQTDLPGITVTDASSGTSTENALKLIPGSGIAISVADNPGAKRAEATITATGGGGGSTSVVAPPARVWRPALSPGAPAVSTPVAVTTGSNYKGMPGFAVGKDGKLYAAYRISTTHGSIDGSSTISVSGDGGATWGSVQTILATGGGHAFIDVGLVTTRTGRMVLTTMDQGVSPNDLAYVYTDTVWVSQSSTTHIQPYTAASYTSCPPLQHSGGVLIWPIYGQDSGDTTYRTGVVISSTDGASWGSRIDIGVANSGYDETWLLELPNGDVLAFIRKEGSIPQAIYTSRSTNAGQSWSTPVSLGFNTYPGRPCAVAFPVTGEIVLVYRSTVNVNTVYRWSADEGATWSGEITIDGTADYVYAAGAPLGDGMIGIVYAVDAFGSPPCNIHFVTMTSGIPVVSGSRAANPALANLLAGMASAGRIVDSTTAGSGPAAAFAWVTKNANYTITTSDQGVLVDCSGGAVTITLPTAVGAGQAYAVKRVDTGGGFAVTIATTGGQLIDGASTLNITASPTNGAVMLGSDGANWYVMASHRMTPGPSFLVMQEGTTFPPIPITSEDGGDWIYTDAL